MRRGLFQISPKPMSRKPKVLIRNETDTDVSAITEVTVAAFKTLQISHHTEQFIVEALRNAKALTVSLVAELNERVVGHIAFSPVTISDGTRNGTALDPFQCCQPISAKASAKP